MRLEWNCEKLFIQVFPKEIAIWTSQMRKYIQALDEKTLGKRRKLCTTTSST